MEVELYVYDLSGGLARQYSAALTGVQIDAIYHTAVVFSGVEYFFGQGIHRKVPGSTHHGRPMEVIRMGRTDLPAEVINEYIQSLESIYTTESYDLFLHNCNNFSQDLCMFLVGKSIPEKISSLPETFLKTPIGQMLRGQIDQSMRQMTQAPDAISGRSIQSKPAPQNSGSYKGAVSRTVFINSQMKPEPGRVHNITKVAELDSLLKSAQDSCAVIFFTSATCPPCKIVYPIYDELASEAGQTAVLMKVDIRRAYEVAMKYNVRATPTFISYLKGEKYEEWHGANEGKLRGNIRLLFQMAHPGHPHSRLRLPSLQRVIVEPVMYKKCPPLDKILAKINASKQNTSENASLTALADYVKQRESNGLIESPIPNLHAFSHYVITNLPTIPLANLFALVDLLRISASDARISSFLASEADLKTLTALVSPTTDHAKSPYALQVTTLQLACNLFSSSVFQESLLDFTSQVRPLLENLASTSLLASHANTRALAAALVYNLAALDHNERMADPPRPDILQVSSMGDLEAALVQAVVNESENKETLHGLLLALGLLLYGAKKGSSIWDLCEVMEVRDALKDKRKMEIFMGELLLREIGEELLGKGIQ